MPTNYNVSGSDLEAFFLTRANTTASYTSTPKSLYTWGDNAYGQLGLNSYYVDPPFEDDNYIALALYKPFPRITNWKTVNMYLDFAAGITQDGNLYMWGRNAANINNFGFGAFGEGNLGILSPYSAGDWSKLCEYSMNSSQSVFAIKTNGTMWVWGDNRWGQLGLGDLVHRSLQTQLGATTSNWSQVGCSDQTTGFIRTDGTMWACGDGSFGALGNGSTASRSSPTQIAGTTWSQIAVSWDNMAAIRTTGTLWAWGSNGAGGLGQGNITDRSSPVQIGALTDWKQAAGGGNHFAAVRTNGTLWAWGRNEYGQLGDGSITFRSSPVQVGALTTWDRVYAGWGRTYAIKTDGTLWAVGINEQRSPLGPGISATDNISSPVQMGGPLGPNDWEMVSSSGYWHVAALRNSY